MNSPKIVAKYISCLSILEENAAIIYNNLSDRIESPDLIKSLLLSISQDSLRHSALLKDIAGRISDSKAKRGDCAENLGRLWSIVSYCLKEVTKKQLGPQDFSILLSAFDSLESALGEEYYIFVQTKTLELMANEISQLYDISSESIKVFKSMIRDEKHHRGILNTIKDLTGADSIEEDSTPKVKYQTPDSWTRSLPPATYNST